jgi:phosphate transport system substrate-binding protein
MKRTSSIAWASFIALLAGLAACSTPPPTNTALPAAITPGARVNVAAQHADKLPAYQRAEKLQGAIRLAGSSAVATFARTWGNAFQRIYPNATVSVVSTNSAAAIGDMATHPGTIGMTSRPLSAAERMGYAKQHGQPPLEFKVAIDAVAIYVFKDNPLQSISLPQLERIFAATPKSGAAIDRWGQIGLRGDWTERAVNSIGFDTGRGAYDLMRELVLRGGSFNADVSAEPVSTSVVQAVGVDPGAIGYASVYYRTARTKMLAVETPGGELAQPTEADAASGKYPLARYFYLYLGASGGSGADAIAREFLRFVLSDEGQAAARASGAFAITPAMAHAQRATLAQ